MKNLAKFSLVIAFVTVIMFSVTSCESVDDEEYYISGTYICVDDYYSGSSITFYSNGTFIMREEDYDEEDYDDNSTANGTYIVSGSNLTLDFYGDGDYWYWKIIDNKTLKDLYGWSTWKKIMP